jgi:hypothetical protein
MYDLRELIYIYIYICICTYLYIVVFISAKTLVEHGRVDKVYIITYGNNVNNSASRCF